jgi:hypothetical protein
MNLIEIGKKTKIFIWARIVRFTNNNKYYPLIYGSYWHSLFFSGSMSNINNYFYTARPNPAAGIGHQMANWNAGYWFARQFGLQFAHLKFSSEKWESVLGFGENEPNAEELIKKNGYKKVTLPLFDEHNRIEVDRTKKIIASYQNQKIVFIAEQDQGYKDQFGVIKDIKSKFHQAKHRKSDHLIYSKDEFNIAIHVRRGDIEIGQTNQNPNLLMRWQNNSYFQNVLSTVINNLKTERPISIYLFSQGKQSEFDEFEKFQNIHYCLEMNAQDSFIHMAYADLLITSKSSFSYKPALLSNGIKVCPRNFWHGYPDLDDWILAEDNGSINGNDLEKLLKIE